MLFTLLKNCSNKITCVILFTLIFSQNSFATSQEINQIINKKKQKILLNFESGMTVQQKSKLYTWVKHGSEALEKVYGEFPLDLFRTQINISKRGNHPVPWGEVTRDFPPKVTLVVNVNSELEELKADWTIYHEFSHLLIPYDEGDVRWFTEGLASYYQNIVQARIGMFDEQTMWQKLYDGFERGDKQQNYNHQTLNYVSEHIRSNRNYMRIYWSGALYWLKVDMALRQLNRDISLDSALKQLHSCCFNDYYDVFQIVKKLDKLTNSLIFSSHYYEFSNSKSIPNYRSSLQKLGIFLDNEQLTLTDSAKLSKLRKAIFNGN